MIKAIIFDFHDTVIENGLSYVFKGKQFSEFVKSVTWRPFWQGEATEREFWQEVADYFGQSAAWIKKSKAIYYSKSVPIKAVLPLARELKKVYKLGLLANCPSPWFKDAVSRFSLDGIFDVLVSSGDTGLLKPDKEIYLLICQKLRFSPEGCFYIDDSQTKLEAAQKLGMKGVLFKNLKQLTKELKKEDILR